MSCPFREELETRTYSFVFERSIRKRDVADVGQLKGINVLADWLNRCFVIIVASNIKGIKLQTATRPLF